jgi:hypothetical protein
MVSQDLINYINVALEKGMSVEEIKKRLLAKGWQFFDIQEAIKIVTSYAKAPTSKGNPLINQKQKTNNFPTKKILFILGGVVVFVILMLVYLSVFQDSTISESSLEEGAYVTVGDGGQFKFSLEKEKHSVEVESIGETYVDLIIRSDPIKIRVEFGSMQFVDIDGDGENDLEVSVSKADNGEIEVHVKKIIKAVSEDSCVESWICTDWGICINETKKRVCSDSNNCGTSNNKLSEEESCGGVDESLGIVLDIDEFIDEANSSSSNTTNVLPIDDGTTDLNETNETNDVENTTIPDDNNTVQDLEDICDDTLGVPC